MEYNFQDMIDRIKTQKKLKGVTNKELSESSGVPYGTLNKILGAETKEPSINAIIKIATALDVTADYIIHGGSVPKNTTPYTPSNMIPIPVIGKVAAGITCLAETDIESYMLADATNLNNDYDYVWLRVTGDSMEPFILDGDYVLVQMQSIVNSGEIAVVIVNGDDGLVKKIEFEKDSITLISSNPYYPPRKFIKEEMNEIRIFGKVIESKRIF